MSKSTGKDTVGKEYSHLDFWNIKKNCARGILQFVKDSTYLGERICTLKSHEEYYLSPSAWK